MLREFPVLRLLDIWLLHGTEWCPARPLREWHDAAGMGSDAAGLDACRVVRRRGELLRHPVGSRRKLGNPARTGWANDQGVDSTRIPGRRRRATPRCRARSAGRAGRLMATRTTAPAGTALPRRRTDSAMRGCTVRRLCWMRDYTAATGGRATCKLHGPDGSYSYSYSHSYSHSYGQGVTATYYPDGVEQAVEESCQPTTARRTRTRTGDSEVGCPPSPGLLHVRRRRLLRPRWTGASRRPAQRLPVGRRTRPEHNPPPSTPRPERRPVIAPVRAGTTLGAPIATDTPSAPGWVENPIPRATPPSTQWGTTRRRAARLATTTAQTSARYCGTTASVLSTPKHRGCRRPG